MQQGGSRTRTGCLTCRRRKVKCDEAKPVCIRCSNANFICEGYLENRSIPLVDLAPSDPSQIHNAVLSSQVRNLHSPHHQISTNPSLFPQSTSRMDQLSAYHQYITCTVTQLFREDQLPFWRDEVARMSWTVDVVYEAIQALGAMHRAHMISSSGFWQNNAQRSKVFGIRAYDAAVRLLVTQLEEGSQVQHEILMVVLVLLNIFECSMGNARIAFQHLWASIQLLKASSASESISCPLPLRETIIRMDFLAQSVIPYARSSFFRTFAFQSPLMERPFYSSTAFNWEVLHDGLTLDPVSIQRLILLRLIAAHNDMDKIVWSSFYGNMEQPRRDRLLSFRAELLLWRQGAVDTFACYEDIAPFSAGVISDIPASAALIRDLSIPPIVMQLPTLETAVTIAYYNCYLACTLSMLASTESTPELRDVRELEAFALTYNNLRLATSVINRMPPSNPSLPFLSSPSANWCTNLDPNISIPLFLGARRCFAYPWLDWTISTLRALGRTGLCNGLALANCLTILVQVDEHNNDYISNPLFDTEISPLGRLCDRTIPLLMPTFSEDDKYEAFYLRHGGVFSGVLARVTWRQGSNGLAEDCKIDWFDGKEAKHGIEKVNDQQHVLTQFSNPLREWKQSLEAGWHTFVKAAGTGVIAHTFVP